MNRQTCVYGEIFNLITQKLYTLCFHLTTIFNFTSRYVHITLLNHVKLIVTWYLQDMDSFEMCSLYFYLWFSLIFFSPSESLCLSLIVFFHSKSLPHFPQLAMIALCLDRNSFLMSFVVFLILYLCFALLCWNALPFMPKGRLCPHLAQGQ